MSDHRAEQELPYFSPLLPWQAKAWKQVTHQFNEGRLPHGILAGGMAGIGKRAFIWRLTAWLLCHDRRHDGACGDCDSCRWLVVGTHPDLMVLPSSSLPTAEDEQGGSIKIDDIRQLQDYSHTKGHGARLIVLDGAESLTLGASNALLKTLEEPQEGVHLLLISDNPSKLLPTIKSRVQSLPLNQIDYRSALAYVSEKLGDEKLAALALDLADGAILHALYLPDSPWFAQRMLWLKTWLALRAGQRLPVVASDYWQGVLSFADFVQLTRLMLMDVLRVKLGLGSRHHDIDVAALVEPVQGLSLEKIERFLASLDNTVSALEQNVQEKMAYDELFCRLADL